MGLKAAYVSAIWMLLLYILTVPICNFIALRQIELLLEPLKFIFDFRPKVDTLILPDLLNDNSILQQSNSKLS